MTRLYDPGDDRLDRARQVLEEAAASAHGFKAQLATRKLRELRAAALLQVTAHQTTTSRIH